MRPGRFARDQAVDRQRPHVHDEGPRVILRQRIVDTGEAPLLRSSPAGAA